MKKVSLCKGPKNQHLIKDRVTVGKKHFIHSSTFTEYSNDIHNVYENIDVYKQRKGKKIQLLMMIAEKRLPQKVVSLRQKY